MAPNALLDNLLTLDPHLGKVMIRRISLTHVPESTSSTRSKMGRNKTRATTVGNHEKERSENPEFCRLSTEVVRDMCGLAHGLLTLSETHWLEDICASELVDDDDEGAEDEVVNTEKHVIENTKEDSYSVPNENDGWLSTPTSHSLLGVRVRCYMDEGDTMDSATEVPLRWYEDGTMVGYLPATEDEPMALWRVCLDSVSDDPSLGLSVSETAAGSSCKVVMASEALRQQMAERVFHPSVQSTARCEDLEEHEVMAAASRFMNAWS